MGLSPEAWVAGYAAIVATGALALEVRRWVEAGPRLFVRANANMMLIGGGGVEKSGLLMVTVANRGDTPTTITSFCLHEYPSFWARWRNRESKSFIVPHPQLEGRAPIIPHVLSPGELWTGIANDRSEITGDIQTGRMWVAIYTTDRSKPYRAAIKKRDKAAGGNDKI